MRRKFLEKEGTLTLEDLLRIARSQEAVDRQMKVMVSNTLTLTQQSCPTKFTGGFYIRVLHLEGFEVRSFMGLVQYSAKFMPDLPSIARPIQDLTRKGILFVWGAEQQKAFQDLKLLITHAETLPYYQVGCRTRIVADALPVGLGAVLTQQQGGVWRIISYASRSLTDMEGCSIQTEKEALALVWACERFSMYVSGQSFKLERNSGPSSHVLPCNSCAAVRPCEA